MTTLDWVDQFNNGCWNESVTYRQWKQKKRITLLNGLVEIQQSKGSNKTLSKKAGVVQFLGSQALPGFS